MKKMIAGYSKAFWVANFVELLEQIGRAHV